MKSTSWLCSLSSQVSGRRHCLQISRALPVLGLCVLVVWNVCICHGQGSGQRNRSTKTSTRIEALVNENPEPSEQLGRALRFSKKYDWKEYERVDRAIDLLVDHIDTDWREMVAHFDDERYCMTYESMSNKAVSMSIGQICKELVRGAITQPHVAHLPHSEVIYRKMCFPEELLNTKIDKWCSKRREAGKELYELQIEVCEWAIAKAQGIIPVAPKRAGDKSLGDFIADVEADIGQMKMKKQPIKYKGWGKRFTVIDKAWVDSKQRWINE